MIKDINTAKWLDLQEACLYSCLSENTLKGLIKAGHIYGKLVGGKWIIDRQTIDDYYDAERAIERIQLEKVKIARGRRRKIDKPKLRML